MKKSLLLLVLVIWCFPTFSQEKWSLDPRMMSIIGDNTTANEPNYESLNYINPNTTVNVVKTLDGDAIVFPNFRVHPSVYTQSEVPITSHPTNKNILFGSANWFNQGANMFSEGIYVTTDGGENWFGSDTLRAAPISDHVGDPAPSINIAGRFYMSYLQRGGSGGIYASNSTDYGNTWANASLVTALAADKNHTFTINNPSSPYNGNTIVSWSNWGSTPNVAVVVTTNNGTSWSPMISVATPTSGTYHQGVNGCQGPDGQAYLIWQSPKSGSPYTGLYLGFAKSTNGGFNWTSNNNVITTNGIRGTLSFGGNSIRVNDFPWMGCDLTSGPRRGWLYVATAQKNLSPAGSDADIIFHRSTNEGVTWSAAKRINQDALNNGKFQYMPALVVGTDGSVNIVYYDNRNTPTNDSVEVYVARSLDGGDTWTEIKVSDHKFKPASISGLATGYQGDYIGIAEGPGGSLFPYWADNKSGIYQAWTAKMLFGPTIDHNTLPYTENQVGPYKVGAKITTSIGLNESKVFLYWTRGTTFDSLLMTKVAADSFVGFIPGNNTSATYKYYIYAGDSAGGYSTSPAGAPAVFHSFLVQPDATPPTVTHTVLGNKYRELWPATVTANVTDNLGIDSAWVVYKLKFNGTLRQFKLGTVVGNSYSGQFNIDTSLIAVGDTMYYRIVGRDNSNAHNLGYFPDATGFNSFKFIADTIFPVLSHTALKNQARVRWPVKISANITDNMGINSVVVQYKINNGIIRNFNLNNISGSSYIGYFNVDTSLVHFGDSISYKIIATDLSTSHNITTKPATGYYVFNIIDTKGIVLVINDDLTLAERSSERGGMSDGSTLGASATVFATALNATGYLIDSVTFAAMDPATLVDYDFVILSGGAKATGVFGDSAKRNALVQFVNNGGKTWVEGGEVGYIFRKTATADLDPVFRRTILNDSSWVSDASSATLTMKDPTHNIFNNPNVLTGAPWAFTGTSIYSRDAVTLTKDKTGVRKVACWSSHPDSAGIIIHYEGVDPTDVRNVYYTFNVSLLTDQINMAKLIENTADVLMGGPPTPVELTSFTAEVSNNTVGLKWITSTELNNLGFEIQRSTDFINYEKVGFVTGNGTTTLQHNYSFSDSKLNDGTYTYRLKQIDLDGTYAYSQSLEVNVISPVVYSLEQNYPNPFNPSTIIKYSIPKDGLVTMMVYNVLGERVKTLLNENMKAGKYEVTFNASSLASGIYFYRLDSGNFSSVKKMLLIK